MPAQPKCETQGRVSSTCVRGDVSGEHDTNSDLPGRQYLIEIELWIFIFMRLLGFCSGLARNAGLLFPVCADRGYALGAAMPGPFHITGVQAAQGIDGNIDVINQLVKSFPSQWLCIDMSCCLFHR